MALDLERIPFGLSNITITDSLDNVVKFDGVEELQAEGGEVTLSPELEDIVIADYGNGAYDQRVVGYTGTVTINAAQESITVLQLALAATEAIVDSVSSDTVGVTDSAIGSSLRAKGKKVHIHPRNLPTEMKDMDITIYKMVSNGEFTRSTGNQQSNITITLTMMPRDGMDPSKPGNFFYLGGTDPNEVVTP